jgi:3-phenylpropionate/cinnamic acid dioxygenase small subunit
VNRHIIGRPRILPQEAFVRVTCPFCVVQTEEGGSPLLFAAGRYEDDLVVKDDRLLVQAKRVVLDNARILTSLPLPL